MNFFPLTLTLICLAAGAAQAQDLALTRLNAEFDTADTDGNNVVGYQEFLAYRAAQWPRIDRNKDGVLSARDFPAVAARRAKAQLSQMAVFDTNGDGVISHTEFINGPTPAFNTADLNNNGMISRNEAAAAARGN
jgi:hypothetical protein